MALKFIIIVDSLIIHLLLFDLISLTFKIFMNLYSRFTNTASHIIHPAYPFATCH